MTSPFKRLLVGKPIATSEEGHQRIGKPVALAVFASDAVSSTAYATEEMMLVLLTAVVFPTALNYLVPLSIAAVILLVIVGISYVQTIHAYPDGGGAYLLPRQIGVRRTKELLFFGDDLSATDAAEMGMINKVVPDDRLKEETRKFALEVADRGSYALASIKGAFNARHGGVAGLSRLSHDLLLRTYLKTDEAKELSRSFAAKTPPDTTKFGH